MIFLKALAGFCNILPGWIWALMFAGAVGTAAVNEHRVSTVKQSLTVERLARANETAQRQAFAIQAEQANRTIEQERVIHAAQIVQAVTSEMQKTAAVRAGFAADNDRLRQQLASFASGSGQSPGDPDTLARAIERASRLGELLASCRAEGRSDAAELEDSASQIRGLQAAYGSLH